MENNKQSTVEKFDCQGFFADKDFWSQEAEKHLPKLMTSGTPSFPMTIGLL